MNLDEELSRPWPLLLALKEGVEGHVGHLDDLEPDAGNITDGVALPTETCHQDFVVLLDEVEATVPRYESRDLLAVLDQLHPDALPDGRVGLLGFDSNLRNINKTFLSLLTNRGNRQLKRTKGNPKLIQTAML